MRTRLLAWAVLWFVAASGALGSAAEPPKPNVLLIVADDLGWRDVGWHGGPFRTPALDELVRTGVELDRHYVQPVCSPTRAALLSGRWTGRFGPHALSPTNRRVFPAGTVTLASALKECGYATHLAGKWHLGSRPEWGPNRYGFDHSYGSLSGAVDPWTHLYRTGPYLDTWHRDGEVFREQGNATELVAAEVLGWIRRKPSPWFIYVPFHAVHIPVDAPAEYRAAYDGVTFDPDPAKDDSLRRLGAFVSQLDAKVGAFVAALEETGQREDTLIVFTSDNGGLAGGGNPYVGGVPGSPALSSNAPLRGHKNELYEGGIRVPAFANWPGRLPARKVDAPLHAADWMPTLAALAGWENGGRVAFDGADAWPVLSEEGVAGPRSIYIPHPTGAAVIRGSWKLIARRGGPAELYDLARDPTESSNMAAEEPGRMSELRAFLDEVRRGDVDTLPADLEGIAN